MRTLVMTIGEKIRSHRRLKSVQEITRDTVVLEALCAYRDELIKLDYEDWQKDVVVRYDIVCKEISAMWNKIPPVE